MSMYAKVRRLKLREGLSISEIARRTSLSRNTFKTWLREPEPRTWMAYQRPPRPQGAGRVHGLDRPSDQDRRAPAPQGAPDGPAAVPAAARKGLHRPLLPGDGVPAGPAGGGGRGHGPLGLGAAAVWLGRGVPVRRKRRRADGRRDLAQGDGGAHEAVRQPGFLAGGQPQVIAEHARVLDRDRVCGTTCR